MGLLDVNRQPGWVAVWNHPVGPKTYSRMELGTYQSRLGGFPDESNWLDSHDSSDGYAGTNDSEDVCFHEQMDPKSGNSTQIFMNPV